MRYATFLPLLLLGAAPAWGQEHVHSPYAGMESHEIKALSPEDVHGYLTGQGMLQALAAELNRYPGPLHVLDLRTELQLSAAQAGQIERIRAHMEAVAIALGRRIVALERELDSAFGSRRITAEELRRLTGAIAAAQGELRAVHLQAHLEVTELLTPGQIDRYHHLRGYH